MAKVKNKRRNLAEKANAKKKKNAQAAKTLNPFEVHINREKMKVLGRKMKNDKGLPGVSRAKALKKRARTILQEYKVQNKANKLVDRRIGERNPGMNEEERIMARFAAERVRAYKKRSIFNLGDDEVLTHKGHALSEIEKFEDDPRSSDDEEDEDKSGKLGSGFVEEAHFGGGVLKRTDREGAKTHKDLIEQLIAESKKRKLEKQKQKEATLELTEKLDLEWKDLQPLINQSKKKRTDEEAKSKADDYDKTMRELKFEARGNPSDRLKTEDEIAREEKEKLEKMERERLERMRGFLPENEAPQKTHRSADDLDDDFVYESENDEQDKMLSYNEMGESNVQIHAQIDGKEVKQHLRVTEETDKNDDDDEENSEDEEGAGESEESENEGDNLSDLKEESSDSEEEQQQSNEKDEQFKKELLKRKQLMETARKELPYTFSLPDSYESLRKTLSGRSGCHHGVIIERMIKCNHPSLGENNKEALNMLFAYLMQYLNDLGEEDARDENSLKNSFEIFNNLTPHLFDLAQLNPENASTSMAEIIKEKQGDYRKKKKFYPGTEVLLFLKLASCLFSTSDFRHRVVTPALVFMEQMFINCRIRNKRDVAYGLFLATLALEYTNLSRRFFPAVINFLTGIIHAAIPKTGVRLIKVTPPFRPICNLLALVKGDFNEAGEKISDWKLNSADLLCGEIDESFKIRSVNAVLQLIKEYLDNYKELSSSVEIFEQVVNMLMLLPKEKYPELVRNTLVELLGDLDALKNNRKLEYIVMEAKRPKALRLYEPKIETVYDAKRHKVQSKQKAERDKLLHKLKKERKGALREIRRDKEYLSRLKIGEKIKSDLERKEKVRKLYSEAAVQQSELNAMDRQKKRKK